MDISITKSAYGTPLLQRRINGRAEYALNGQELCDAAMKAIEPELRRRWTQYWQKVAAKAAIVENITNCDELMAVIARPDSKYACPPELAARAIWPTSDAEPQRVIEAAKS